MSTLKSFLKSNKNIAKILNNFSINFLQPKKYQSKWPWKRINIHVINRIFSTFHDSYVSQKQNHCTSNTGKTVLKSFYYHNTYYPLNYKPFLLV